MVTPEAHDVVISAPWYVPAASRTVAIHRYLDPAFVDRFRADVMRAPERNAGLFDWEAEDQLGDGFGSLKLRRTLHRAFYLAAWEAGCRIPGGNGFPAIAPEKIASAGFVIRSGDPGAPLGFSLSGGTPIGWAPVETGIDPDVARQLRAFGLVSKNAAPVPGYTGEETHPLHPLAVQGGGRPRTLLFGFLPIGGAQFVPPTPPAVDSGSLPDELPWPFGLQGRSGGAPPDSGYTFDRQIAGGYVDSRLAAVLRVVLSRYQLATPGEWAAAEGAHDPLVAILDGLQFFADPPASASGGAALRQWAADNATSVTLGSVLSDVATAQELVTRLLQLDPASSAAQLPARAAVAPGYRNLLIVPEVAAALRSVLRDRQLAATVAAVSTLPLPKFASGGPANYFVVPFVRTIRPDGCPRIHWGSPSKAFAVAAAFDPTASRPSLIEMPDLADALQGAANGASFDMPPALANLANNVQSLDDFKSQSRPPSGLGIRFICSFSLPVITICAMLMLSIMVGLLNLFMMWMPFVKICLPMPGKSGK